MGAVLKYGAAVNATFVSLSNFGLKRGWNVPSVHFIRPRRTRLQLLLRITSLFAVAESSGEEKTGKAARIVNMSEVSPCPEGILTAALLSCARAFQPYHSGQPDTAE